MSNTFHYSEKYHDDAYEYRHVHVPRTHLHTWNKKKLLTEEEWRGIGIQMSKGWVHYMIHNPQPHILLFRRPIGTDPMTGKVEE